MKRTDPKIIEISFEQLQATVQHAEERMDEPYSEIVCAVFEAYRYVIDELGKNRASLGRMQRLFFGGKTEKTAAVVGEDSAVDPSASSGEETPAESSQEPAAPSKASKKKRKGHGRNGANAYRGAKKIFVPHPHLEAGDACPECEKGTVYNMAPPRLVVRLVGQAPVSATVYQLQRLRCGLCGKIFTAPLPEEAGAQKYDATVVSMLGLLRYGSGMPFNRMAGLEGNLGIPLPAPTQWDILVGGFAPVDLVFTELIRQGAQGDVLHNDDTPTKILDRMGKRLEKKTSTNSEPSESADGVDPSRTGLFTSGIVSRQAGRTVALFFSSRKHAGENLRDVLSERASELSPPIQMCDALSRNLPKELETIVANCLAHGRRRFTDLSELFPDECKHVLLALREIYKNDAQARQRNLSPEERLEFHQAQSRSTMDQLHDWLNRQLDDHLVEPNSALGEAIRYMLNHWEKLTLFLRKAGAPLDNNICERALKKAIRHRKNSLFFKSDKGAHVGDAFMSIIHTCELNGVNPFDYLTEIQRHAKELALAPENWMPWNYQQTLAAVTASSAPAA